MSSGNLMPPRADICPVRQHRVGCRPAALRALRRLLRWTLVLSLLVGIVGGCAPPPAATVAAPASPLPDDDSLRQHLDEVLDWTYENRHLNLRDHAAWQILHGVLAYQRSFLIETEPGGKRVSALDHLLAGGAMKGWTLTPGQVFDEQTGRRGLHAELEPGSKTGQGHVDQWLAILAQCAYPSTQPIVLKGRTFTIRDMADQAQWEVPRNVQREYSWTLIGLSAYLPSTAKWAAQDGREWSIEQLVDSEADQELETSACGGTHRLSSLAMAWRRHVTQGGRVEGVWAKAEQKIAAGIADAQRYQNPDGSFSSNYFERGGKATDLAQDIAASGHIFEFLSGAIPDGRLREPWLRSAAAYLCGVLDKTKEVPLECGGLYHAVHGLIVYRQRVFGGRTWPAAAPRGQAAAE
jgi:hypothetical protein